MGAEFAAVMFGLASAITWGGGDFLGGLGTRRMPVLLVLLANQAAGLVLLLVLALLFGEPIPSWTSFEWGAAAGVAGTVGLGALYRGLSVGRASVVAPTSAVLAAALPAIIGIATEGAPGTLRIIGFVVALAGIWLVARAPSETSGESGIVLARIAGVGFGGFFVLIDQASGDGTFWPLATARTSAILITFALIVLRRQPLDFSATAMRLAICSGILDVGGNAFFVLASQRGRLDVAAILASLYPASTVLLSRVVLGERVSLVQSVGVALALVAVVLIAL